MALPLGTTLLFVAAQVDPGEHVSAAISERGLYGVIGVMASVCLGLFALLIKSYRDRQKSESKLHTDYTSQLLKKADTEDKFIASLVEKVTTAVVEVKNSIDILRTEIRRG